MNAPDARRWGKVVRLVVEKSCCEKDGVKIRRDGHHATDGICNGDTLITLCPCC